MRNKLIKLAWTFNKAGAAVGVIVVLLCRAALGQTIPNPSFEANAFTVSPGTITDNTAITGWTATDPSLAVGHASRRGEARSPALVRRDRATGSRVGPSGRRGRQGEACRTVSPLPKPRVSAHVPGLLGGMILSSFIA